MFKLSYVFVMAFVGTYLSIQFVNLSIGKLGKPYIC